MRRFFVGLAIGLATVAPSWAQANDEQIAQEIIEKLQSKKDAGELKGFNIDLEVDQGTVWLSGSVATPEQQKAAIEIARHVSGVEKVVNQLKVESGEAAATPRKVTPTSAAAPKPSLLGSMFAKPVPATQPTEAQKSPASATPEAGAKSDQQLVQDILAKLKALKQSGQLKGFRMDVQAEDGLVWLSGDVSDPIQHRTVIETVRRIPGVKQVVNDLKVKSAPTPARTEGASLNETSGRGGDATTPESDVPNIPGFTAIPVGKNQSSRATMSPAAKLPEAEEGTGVSQTSGYGPVAATPAPAPAPAPTPAVAVAVAPPSELPANPSMSIPGYTAIPVRVGPAPGVFAPPAGMAPLAPQGVRTANRPLAFAPANGSPMLPVSQAQMQAGMAGPETPLPAHMAGPNVGITPARYDHPNMPGYAWPSYASHPNYAAVTYPKQYSPAAWPYIGPFYPYPQVPLGWRKVTLKWDDGWWNLDFKSK